MSENKSTNNFSIVNLPEMPESVDNAFKNLTDAPSKTIGETFNDLLYLAFGRISLIAQERRITYAAQLEKFKDELKSRVDSTPKEKLIEPNTRLILTALNTARYTVEDEALRTMFANLIANSMNNEFANFAHPSFVSIINDLSSLDAENLALFKRDESYPIATYKVITNNNQFIQLHKNIFLSNPNNKNVKQQSSSLSILERLGLIYLNYNKRIPNLEEYKIFEELSEYKDILSEISANPEFKNYKLEIQKGVAELTELGKDFLRICV